MDLLTLVERYLRAPVIVAGDVQGGMTFTFEPPLTVDEEATLVDLRAMAKSPFTAQMTLEEYQVIKPFLVTERAWVQASRNTFVQTLTTDIEQRRLLFDALTAVIRVQLLQNRDG